MQRSLTGARRAVGDITDAIDATTTVRICRDERGGGVLTLRAKAGLRLPADGSTGRVGGGNG